MKIDIKNDLNVLEKLLHQLYELRKLDMRKMRNRWSFEKKNELAGMVGSQGICLYIQQGYNEDLGCYLRTKFRTWKYFSGQGCYPVGSRSGKTPSELYVYGQFKNMWVAGGYARRRWNLVDHLIREVEKDTRALIKGGSNEH